MTSGSKSGDRGVGGNTGSPIAFGGISFEQRQGVPRPAGLCRQGGL